MYYLNIILIVALTAIVCGKEPGFKGRITEKGLKFVKDLGLDVVMDKVQDLEIPDQSPSVLGYTIKMKNIYIVEIPETYTSTLQVKKNAGVEWHVKNLSPHISMNYEYNVFWSKTTGHMQVKGRGIGFKILFYMTKTDAGKMRLSVTRCNAFGEIELSFKSSWLLNSASSLLKSFITKKFKKMICEDVVKKINHNSEKEIDNLPFKYRVRNSFADFFVNLRLTDNPLFNEEFLDISHVGELSFVKHQILFNFTAPPIPDMEDTHDKMAYAFITNHFVNSGLFALHSSNKLKMNITKEQVLEHKKYHSLLKTTCKGGESCLGTFFGEVATKYKDMDLFVEIATLKAPKVDFDHNQISIMVLFESKVFVRTPKGDVQLIRTIIHTTAPVRIHLDGTHVTVKVGALINDLVDLESEISLIETNPFMITSAIKFLEQQHIMKLINGYGNTGFHLPTLGKKVKLINPEFIRTNMENVIAIGVDFEFMKST